LFWSIAYSFGTDRSIQQPDQSTVGCAQTKVLTLSGKYCNRSKPSGLRAFSPMSEELRMKLHLISVVLFSLASSLCAQNPLTPQALPEPILSGKSEFRIPYQYDPAEIQRLGAQQIQLFVSTNQGALWQKVQAVRPQSGRFQFRAPADGDYWFSVQTIDSQNRAHPGGQKKPGLIVRVDTTRPVLQMNLKPIAGGKVELSWNTDEVAINANSLRFRFTQTGMSGWQQLPVQLKSQGQTVWSIPAGGMVAVQGSVRDKAGNETSSQVTTQVPAQGAVSPNTNQSRQPAVPDPRVPIASNPLMTPPPIQNSQQSPILQALPGFQNDPSAVVQQQLPPNQQLPFENPNPLPRNEFPPRNTVAVDPQPMPLPQTTEEPIPRPIDNRPMVADPFRHDSFVSSSQPIQTNQVPFTPRRDTDGYRVVRTRKFNVDYRIDDVGPSGVGSVEMYVTQNNGEKWYRYGVDKDRRSPFEVEVPGDGIFGFSMRVVSGAGLTDDPPRPGDRPEIVVVADSSPPVVRLFPLQQGTGPNANKILITWQASDQKLAERPVSLLYSANPNGPWEPISGWTSNTGKFVWSVNPSVPTRLYVRLMARDAAGNMQQVDTPQPVLVDLAKPTARIVDVESTRLAN
jgi:hypothetical protein